jgi:hypothetical protein
MYYTADDYFTASKQRTIDFRNFAIPKKSLIASAYLSGVAVECMLRGNILKYTREFDEKHDLNSLLIKSKILDNLSPHKRLLLSTYMQTLNKKWMNNMRYNSIERTKRSLAHELARVNRKRVGTVLNKYFREIIETSEKIIEIGEKNGFTR